MKYSVSEKNQNFARRLLEITLERRALEKEEKALKTYFKAEIGDSGGMETGGVLITLQEKERTGLDRDALMLEFGSEKLQKFEKTTAYVQVDVKALKPKVKEA